MLGLPVLAAASRYPIDQMIYMVHGLMLILFVGWGIFFIVALIKFNRHTNPKANYQGVTSHFSSVIEIAVIFAEIILLVAFSIPFWATKIDTISDAPDTVEIRIVAEQFAWNIHYPGKDKKFGKTNPKLIDQQNNPIGLDLSDPAAKDDITTVNQLHLPVGRPIMIHLSSKDVIHCFTLPQMRVKQDVIPGMSIQTWFTPTKTGQWEIMCAQLCGIGHYRMKGYYTIHTQEKFDEWMSSQATAGGAGNSSEDSFWN